MVDGVVRLIFPRSNPSGSPMLGLTSNVRKLLREMSILMRWLFLKILAVGSGEGLDDELRDLPRLHEFLPEFLQQP